MRVIELLVYHVRYFVYFIKIKVSVTIINLEINTEYRVWSKVAVGAGIARLCPELVINAPNFTGNVTDIDSSFTSFGTFYL